MTVIDIDENKEVLSLAEMFYRFYSFDAIPFTINASKKIIEFSNELYPNKPKKEQEKLVQILKLEIIAKFCLYAESLAAIAITFTYTYDDMKKEMMGLFSKVGDYNVNQVIDFYTNIQNRDMNYVAKIIGYPPLILQQKQTKKALEISSLAVRDEIKKIADLYLELRLLYNAYKHGYRVFFGKDEQLNDVFAFIEKGKKQKAVVVDKDKFNEINRAVKHIRKIMKLILDTHKTRLKFENGQTNIQLSIMWPPNTPPLPDVGNKVHYPSRGEQCRIDDEEFKQVYTLFKEELERTNLGKYVAFDMDSKKILGVDENLEILIEKISEHSSAGRKRITKIGSKGTLYEMY
jgi:hypothetical protein